MAAMEKPSFFVTREIREQQKNQKSIVLWFSGLSASGKSTIANELEKLLLQNSNHTIILDGDFFRSGLSSDLSFDRKNREENMRRIRYVAEMFCEAGLITMVTFISPFKADREKARSLLKNKYIDVYVKVSLETAEKRDPKGLYRKARHGEISNFTGIDSPYEPPENPEILLKADVFSARKCAEKIFNYLKIKTIIF